jgi:hypothetical protein
MSFTEQVDLIPWTDEATAIAAICTAIILFLALGFAWHEVRCIEKARKAQLLTGLSKWWNEELLRESRQAAEKYKNGIQLQKALENFKKTNDKEYYVLLRLPDFFEDLGLLVNSECFSKQLATDLFGTAMKYHYERYKPAIEYLRTEFNDKTIYKFFEDLATNVSA